MQNTVAARLAALSAPTRRTLQVASAIGPRFDVLDLARLMHCGTAQLLPALDEAIASGLLVSVDDRLMFSHALVHAAVAASLCRPAAAALRAELAALWATTPARPSNPPTPPAASRPCPDDLLWSTPSPARPEPCSLLPGSPPPGAALPGPYVPGPYVPGPGTPGWLPGSPVDSSPASDSPVGGSPIGGAPVPAGGSHVGGTPIPAGGSHVGGTPVPAGGTHVGGTPIPAGGTHVGGTPVPAGGTPVGGTPLPGLPPSGGARPGGQAGAVAGWESLTEQELRIARLVGRALTNQQIATRIGRSRHTVNYHLRRIFHKLGIASRVELASLVRAMR